MPVLETDPELLERIADMRKTNRFALFNTIVGIALILRNDHSEIQAPADLYGYFDYCVKETLNTCFGRLLFNQG
jgi:hypothetical protein